MIALYLDNEAESTERVGDFLSSTRAIDEYD
jgi:hypothetical protein